MSPLLAFFLSLVLLLVAARFFTQAAENIGLAFGMSPFAVGVLIVALGTSLPELLAGIVAVGRGSSEIVAGNVLGASTSNLLFILGAVAVAAGRKIDLGHRYLYIDLHFLVGSAFVLTIAMWGGKIGRLEGLLLLAVYGVYTVYLLKDGKNDSEVGPLLAPEKAREPRPWLGSLAVLAVSGVGLGLGARWTITALEDLANTWGVPKAVISLTVLSLGTTLPELAVSVIAARRGQAAMAVGNILGSCVFNSLVVAGTAAAVGGVEVPASLLGFALPFYLAASLLFYLLTQDRNVSRWEGLLFLCIYVLFLGEVSGLL